MRRSWLLAAGVVASISVAAVVVEAVIPIQERQKLHKAIAIQQ